MKVLVTLELDIDAEEWTRQFPDENTPEIIAREVASQVRAMVGDHYYDQGWTRERHYLGGDSG